MQELRVRRLVAGAGLAAMGAVALAGPAWGVHWPFFGGDNGRSGFQPVEPGSGPLDFVYARTGPEDRAIVNSIITSAGMPDTQRVIWGSADGRIHMRTLLAGNPVGAAAGVDVSDEADAFGDGIIGSVSFGETSTGTGLGQVFAPHNDPAGVSIAQVDETAGTLVQDVAVAAAAGFTVNSSVMLTGAAADGSRALYFVAENAADVQALFRVPITAAGTTGAVIGAATRTADINATPEASPTFVFLETPGVSGGAGVGYLAVGTLDGKVLTFAAADLAAGPAATVAGANDVVMTPSVAVASNGMTPGSTGTGTPKAVSIYVASTANATFANPTSRVHRLAQAGNSPTLSVANSPAVAGAASSALATDQVIAAATGVAGEGSVFLATESNLYSIRTADLSVGARLSTADRVPGATGFRGTVPVAQGNRVAITTDSGQQLVLDSGTLQPVAASEFTQDAGNAGSAFSVGQPSVSRGFVQFASDKGLFVYKFRTSGAVTTVPPTTAPPTTTPPTTTPPTTAPPTTTPPTTVPPVSPPVPAVASGYRLVASDGGIFAFGGARFFGSTGNIRLNRPVVGIADTPSGNGYWLVASDGGIFAFGDARFFGSTGAITLNQPIVGMAATPSGNGYWLVASDGGIFAFGDARFLGSTGATRLNRPVVGMAATPSGNGYWLVASDGGIFAFGDARFLGSTGAITLNRPVVGIAATPSGNGYWLVASDGGIFAFGDARFLGSTGAITLNRPVVGIAGTPSPAGYYLAASDGGIFAFGNARFFGSTGNITLNQPVVGIAAS